MVSSRSDSLTDAVRRFQWFYMRHVQAPYELVEHSALSLTEMRVLFAVMHAGTCTAADISRTLGLDTGYLSRMLTQFERSALIEWRSFAADAPQHSCFPDRCRRDGGRDGAGRGKRTRAR